MSATLRVCLMALVFVNLVFVHATEAASLTWLAPLYLLTLASPWLGRLRRHLLVRVIWNLAVVGLFALLVHHATNDGVAYMLEDGLRLAAICQVHLLNNLGDEQRPDLLFFNSFLVALVTAFLTQDVVYSGVFLIYAPVLIVSLAVHCVAPPGQPRLAGRVLAAVGADGLKRAAVVVAITMAVFFVFPRDFHRRGLLGKHLAQSPGGGALEIGFSEQVQLERSGPVTASGRVVMRVTVERGDRTDVPAHWRGATFLVFDGDGWTPGPNEHVDATFWSRGGNRRWTRDVRPGPGTSVRVALQDPAAKRLFAPLNTRVLDSGAAVDPALVDPRGDGTVRYAAGRRRAPGQGLPYRLELGGAAPPLGGEFGGHLPRTLWPSTYVDPAAVPPGAREIAAEIRAALGEGPRQYEVVEALRMHLASRTDYLPPGSNGAATSLDDFLNGGRGGHCEHFATALAVLLRTERIPCRLVTGYLSDEWDTTGRTLTVRRRHAHAWVEVLDPEGGWYTVDPSPSVGIGTGDDGPGLLALARLRMAEWWDKVVGFDEDTRAAAFAWIAAVPGRIVSGVRTHPVAAALWLLGLAAALWLVRHLRPDRQPPVVRDYRAAVRAAGIPSRSGETPREYLRRVQVAAVKRPVVERLAIATRAHEAARYG